jgi:polyhydroxyalkanoate synthesis regulator phasin
LPKDKITKALQDQQVLMQAMQKEMTGLKLLVETVRALIDTLVEKGIVTKNEISERFEKGSAKEKK